MTTQLARRAACGDLAPEVRQWFADAMRRHLAGDDLDRALGLDRPSRLRERNAALSEAAALLGGATPWATARRLQVAIRTYQGRIAPLVARDPDRPLEPVYQAIRRAFDTGQRVPTTVENLYRLMQ